MESALKKRIKALGGEIRKVKFIAVNGAPDRLVYLPRYRSSVDEVQRYCREHEVPVHAAIAALQKPARLVWVELKRPGGPPPTDRQIAEHELLRAHGQTVLVIDSLMLIDYYFPLKG